MILSLALCSFPSPLDMLDKVKVSYESWNLGVQCRVDIEYVMVSFALFSSSQAQGEVRSPQTDLAYWQGIAKDFLLPNAPDVMSLTMWRDTESKSFVVREQTFPRFFTSCFSSGLLRVALNLGSVRETSQNGNEGVVRSEETSWVFTFTTGYVITLRGPLDVVLVAYPTGDAEKPHSLRFRRIRFSTSQVDKHLDIRQIQGDRIRGPIFSPLLQHYTYLENGHQNGGGSSTVSVSSSPPDDARDDNQESSLSKPAGERWIELRNCRIPPDPVNEYGFTDVTERALEVSYQK